MRPFLKSYLRGEALYWFWGLLEKLVTAVGAFFILSELDVYKYGVYILLFSFYSLTAGIFLQPLQEVIFNDLTRFAAAGKIAEAKRLFLENWVVRMIFAVLLFLGLFFGADLIARYYDQDIAGLFRLLSVLYFIDVSNTTIRMFLRFKLRFGLVAMRPMLFKIFRLAFILFFLSFFNFGIREALISHLGAAFLATLVFVPAFIKEYRPWSRIKTAAQDFLLAQIIRRHGKWSIFGSSLSQLTGNIRPWLIKAFVNTEAVAIFSVAESLYGTVKAFFPDSTLMTLIPRKIADRAAATAIFVRGTKYLTLLALLMIAAGFFLAPPFIRWLLPHYAAALPFYQALIILLLPIFALRTMAVTFLVAWRRQKFLFFTGTVQTFGEIILSIPFLYFFSTWGMVWQRVLLSFVITVLLLNNLLKREFPTVSLRQFFVFDRLDKVFLKEFLVRFRRRFSLF